MTTNNAINSSSQVNPVPFNAYPSAAINNVTGDGTVYTVILDTTQVNTDGNYNVTTGQFTAPAAGNYLFTFFAIISDIAAGHTTMNCKFHLSAGTDVDYYIAGCNPAACGSGTTLVLNGSAQIPMGAGVTCEVRLTVSGGTKTIDIEGAQEAQFSGFRIN